MHNFMVPEQFKSQLGQLAQALAPLITKKRMTRMQQIVKNRSKQICAVFENTHHAHNISAVLRTMDALGFLDVLFLYDNPEIKFRTNDSIDRSSSQWLNIENLKSIDNAVKQLKQNNYKIALVSRPDFSQTNAFYQKNIPSFSTSEFNSSDFLNSIKNHKIALVFGTELFGISEKWNEYGDFYVSVDMYGFCESLNVSVCAGIILNAFRETLHKNNLLQLLSNTESALLLEKWVAKQTPYAKKFIYNKHPELREWYSWLIHRSGNDADWVIQEL